MALNNDQKDKIRVGLALTDQASDQEIVDRIDRSAADVADVAEPDADATYGQPEADLINELKAQVNSLLAALRAAGLME